MHNWVTDKHSIFEFFYWNHLFFVGFNFHHFIAFFVFLFVNESKGSTGKRSFVSCFGIFNLIMLKWFLWHYQSAFNLLFLEKFQKRFPSFIKTRRTIFYFYTQFEKLCLNFKLILIENDHKILITVLLNYVGNISFCVKMLLLKLG